MISIRNAVSTIQQLVESQSGGKLKFDADRVRFDLWHLRFNFSNPELSTNDTTNIETGYHIRANSLSIKVQSLSSILTTKLFIIDSVEVQYPVIEVNRYQKGEKVKISVPEEMNVIYISLRKVLAFINLDYLLIDAAKFIINDFTTPGSSPTIISKINLVIENINDAKGAGDTRFLLADRIMFEIFDQDIASSNGLGKLKFKRLRLSTGSRTMNLDSCFISISAADSSVAGFNAFVDTVRVTNVDFNALVKDGRIKVDSALCINPEFNFLARTRAEKKSRKSLQEVVENSDSLDFMLKKMLGDLDIGYLEVRNAKVKITTQRGDKSNVFQIDNSNFNLKGFLVSSDPAIPIQLERFNLHLMNYRGYSSDSLYVVSFDEIQFLNKSISLLNFRIGPTRANHEILSREIKMAAFEFNDIDWPKLLYDSRIVAGSAVMIRPELHFKLPETTKRSSGEKTNPMDLLGELKNTIQVDGLFIRDGFLTLDIMNSKYLAVDHLNAEIGINRLLQVENSYRLIDAVDTLSFSKGEFSSPDFSVLLTNGSFSSKSRSLNFSQITQANIDKSLSANLNNLTAEGLHFDSPEHIRVRNVKWEEAEINVNTLLRKSSASTAIQTIKRKITVGSISGGKAIFDIKGKNLEAKINIKRLKTDQTVIESGKKPEISGLFVVGNYIHLKKEDLRADVGAFIFSDHTESELNSLEGNLPAGSETVFLNIPKVIFTADLTRVIEGDLTVGSLEVQNPVISFLPKSQPNETPKIHSKGKIPKLNISRLIIKQPRMIGLPKGVPEKMKFNTGNSDWMLLGIHTDSASVKVDTMRFTTTRPFFSNSKISLLPTNLETVAINASNIHFQPATAAKTSNWSLELDKVKTSGFDFNILSGDTIKQHIVLQNLNLSNLLLNNNTVDNIHELVISNRNFSISGVNLLLEDDKIRLKALNLSLDQASSSFSMDSLAFSPLEERDAFMKGSAYRRGYAQLYTGFVQLKRINFEQLLKDTVLHSGNVVVNNLRFITYTDKRLPFQQGIEKPMLTDLFRKIKTKFILDSVLLKNSEIVAEEINDKTLLPGRVDLTKIRGVITGIRNCDYSDNDILGFNLYTRFMDATDLRVNYQESYTDSLSNFQIKAIASSFDLTALNPMLKPFASAKVKSGYLDTLRMSVTGRKYVAYGIMKLHYHNLNVQYLNQGSEDKPTTRTRFITFFANSIVRRHRLLGSGEVYAERDPEKGFVNYWVKIFIGGVLTNTGVKSDKKQERKYANSIKKYQVPPIPNIPVDY